MDAELVFRKRGTVQIPFILHTSQDCPKLIEDETWHVGFGNLARKFCVVHIILQEHQCSYHIGGHLWNTLTGALLHDRANELANQSQELLCVSGVELLEQGQQAEHQGRPVHRVSGLSAGHSLVFAVLQFGQLSDEEEEVHDGEVR
uniref:Uncharacterized protein n=1 Tax=Anguilla anguilla TaxID=7936 RepID=A0A0E9WTQ2_ANGAN